VSRTPGRTQLINFFELAPEQRLVDLPGYGFAKVPEKIRLHWLALMEHYFNVRESLVGLMLIVDSRRGLVRRMRRCSNGYCRETASRMCC
jgi:GTP-binding protein